MIGKGVKRCELGDRVGVAWIFSAYGECEYCRRGLENVCSEFRVTGRDVDDGYGEYMIALEKFVYPVPERSNDSHAAPHLETRCSSYGNPAAGKAAGH